ncbi:hypothetical protein BD626DRAFT_638521 [Schizophyllum amplum]|uniref:BTB domain-containing protein n=1 Tax=Schizophyllum amplum TaxID=97359 RepID=A0A550BRN8_9AGAR|nr:hypothetical protein BD626DRAFT_638521 [Auriculariopsis ampla]
MSGFTAVQSRSDPWLDDGNVVLQVDGHLFRVHRSVLAEHSTIFKDMFSIAKSGTDEIYDGQPLVELQGDDHRDMRHYLCASYHFDKSITWGLGVAAFPQFEGVLRVSHKYGALGLRRSALHQLLHEVSKDFPFMLLPIREFLLFETDGYPLAVLKAVFTLACDVDIPWLLPNVAYYLLAYNGFELCGSQTWMGRERNLDGVSLALLIEARTRIHATWPYDIFTRTTTRCQGGQPCFDARLKLDSPELREGMNPPTETWEESVLLLGEAIDNKHALPGTDTASRMQAYGKNIQQHLKSRPLHVLLNVPPTIPVEEYTVTPVGRVMVAALLALKKLYFISVHPALRRLWPFDDAAWPKILRWTEYFAPFYSYHTAANLPLPKDEATGHLIMLASLGITQCIASLPKAQAADLLLSSDNNALSSVIVLWLHWSRVTKSPLVEIMYTYEPVMSCPSTFRAVWSSLEPEVAKDVIGTRLLTSVGGKHKHIFRAGAAHLRALLAHGPSANDELKNHILLIEEITCKYPVNSRTFPACYMAALIAVVNARLTNTPGAAKVWVMAVVMILRLCCRGDHAKFLAIEHGIFPTLVRLRRLREEDCDEPHFLNPGENIQRHFGEILELVADMMSYPRALRGFHAHEAAIPSVSYRKDEEAILTIAKRRYALLDRAEEDWARWETCCNPNVC